jgi:hypothetical protein
VIDLASSLREGPASLETAWVKGDALRVMRIISHLLLIDYIRPLYEMSNEI